MARKRANGEGTIVKNIRNGVQKGWRASITIGRDKEGKLKRKEFTGKTQQEVRKKLEQNKYKLYVGEIYNDNNYVFSDELGNPIDDKRPGRNLKTVLKSLDIEPIKFHALRHTYATRLFEAKVQPKTVQVLMGHYDISITMDIYTHVMEDVKIEAVDKLNDIFKI